MILQFGPLIRTWTLCFKSKHCYFKRVVKSYGNFINITKTLANHHQKLQSYLMEIGLFKKELELYVELVAVEYSPEIISCLSLCFFDVKNAVFTKKFIKALCISSISITVICNRFKLSNYSDLSYEKKFDLLAGLKFDQFCKYLLLGISFKFCITLL